MAQGLRSRLQGSGLRAFRGFTVLGPIRIGTLGELTSVLLGLGSVVCPFGRTRKHITFEYPSPILDSRSLSHHTTTVTTVLPLSWETTICL